MFKKLDKVNFEKLGKQEVLSLLKEFDDLIYDYWETNWMCDKFDPEGHNMLKREIKESKLKLSKEEVGVLTQPIKLNFMEYSELDLYKLAKELQAKGLSDAKVLNYLKDYAKKYFYIENSWSIAKVLKEKDFLPLLKELIKKPLKELEKRIKEIETKEENMNNKVSRIIKKHNISKEMQNIFYMYRKLSELRDERKYYVLKSNHFYMLFAKRIAEIYNTELKLILKTLPRELLKIESTAEFRKELEKRDKYVLVVEEKEHYILSDKDARECINLIQEVFLEKHTEIKGYCASKGQVEGIVKVVCAYTHFSKFKEGDILVAPMTRPEYIPLMKKAKAIITDEGGLTSHAAIVSRELKKPCIVGTHVATRKLDDGDKVFVDANKGVVRKIK
ncbi:MAG: hypothetical protein ISS25_02615 [Nanoarchaeota archaeon]|nr:hypothetical protein [DPANN group archaeon]MBL7116696.1 hypothetical protein [Nanoarchaeota archaeon]